MKPLGRKVVIQPKEAGEGETESGILYTGTLSSKQAQGTIISIGGEVKDVEVGQIVFYSPLLYEEIEHNDETYHVIEEQDIHAIVE